MAGLAGLPCRYAARIGGGRSSGVDDGAHPSDARPAPSRGSLPAVGFCRPVADEVSGMIRYVDPLLIVALALNFVALGVSRIRGVINAVALQGMLLGVLPLWLHTDIGLRGVLLVI